MQMIFKRYCASQTCSLRNTVGKLLQNVTQTALNLWKLKHFFTIKLMIRKSDDTSEWYCTSWVFTVGYRSYDLVKVCTPHAVLISKIWQINALYKSDLYNARHWTRKYQNGSLIVRQDCSGKRTVLWSVLANWHERHILAVITARRMMTYCTYS